MPGCRAAILQGFLLLPMRVLRHAAVDLLAFLLALVAVSTGTRWAYYVVLGYSVLMLVLKLGAAFSKVRAPRPADALPDVFFHVLYGAMVLIFTLGAYLATGAPWWGLAAAWAAIWGLSWWSARRGA